MPGKSGSRKCSEPTEFKDVVPTQLEFRTNGGENKGYTRLSVRSIREGKDRGIQGRRTQKRTLGQRWGVGPVLPGPSLCALRYIVLPSRQQGPGKAKEVPTARIVTSQTQTCLFSSPSHQSAIWATERGIAGANTTSEPPSHWHLCDTQRHSTHRCLGHWPNKEIQDKPAVLSWPHPAGRQKQWQRGIALLCFMAPFRKRWNSPSVTPLRGCTPWHRRGAGTLLGQSYRPPATSQRMKSSNASLQTLHSNWQELLRGSVSAVLLKKDIRYTSASW